MVAKWGGGFIILVLVMGACSHGVKEVREAAANRAPLELTCARFVEKPPTGSWVRLQGASGRLRLAAVRKTNDVADRVYLPLTCDASGAGSVHVVVASEDRALVDDAAAGRDVAVARDFVGMVRSKEDHQTGTTSGGGLEGGCTQCSTKIERLDPGYVVLEEGHDPSWLRGLGWLAAAVAGSVAMLRVSRSA